jgi:NADH-quinone oxidoreductase subunit J
MDEAVFYLFTFVMLVAALSVVLNRQPVYSVLSLLVVMFCLAALFIMLHAYFLAALQVLLYAGAVLVLFLFVIMLLNLQPDQRARRVFLMGLLGAFGASLFYLRLTDTLQTRGGEPYLYAVHAPSGTVESLGRLLFTKYLLPFELASFLILAAIVGAVSLSRQQPPRK